MPFQIKANCVDTYIMDCQLLILFLHVIAHYHSRSSFSYSRRLGAMQGERARDWFALVQFPSLTEKEGLSTDNLSHRRS